ncbi:MAG: methyl-accepting chemotaxis protein [Candidatus Omnitrophica bacterium]|nr:methyl-accepting chemotaxis protein [Candidatus Omnitrophota bacterium]
MPKRRNYFINRKFQLRYTLSIVAILAVVMIASGVGIYFGMWGSIIENFSQFKVSQNLETAKRITDYEDVRYRKGDYRLEKIFREAELLSAQQQDALKNALKAVNHSLFPKIAVLAVIIFIAGIFISHKIAGPMYRIEKSAESIRDGDLSVSFRVRKGDEMKEASTALEEMVDSLQADFVKIKTAGKALDERIGFIEPQIKGEDARRLKDIVKVIDEVLSKYKT